MKLKMPFFVFILFTISTYAQIDNRNNSIVIPAIESKKDPIDMSPSTPLKAIPNTPNTNNLNAPKTSTNINLPKKEFSMFPDEKFGNPGELFTKQINKNIQDLRLSKEELKLRNGNTTDQYLGEFKTGSKFVNVVYRDYGFVDGDLIQVLINDDIIYPRIFLTGGFKGFKLDLQKGFNKIDFLALNQGSSGPNTAEFRVMDDGGNIISSNQWNLATGVKATINIIKE